MVLGLESVYLKDDGALLLNVEGSSVFLVFALRILIDGSALGLVFKLFMQTA